MRRRLVVAVLALLSLAATGCSWQPIRDVDNGPNGRETWYGPSLDLDFLNRCNKSAPAPKADE